MSKANKYSAKLWQQSLKGYCQKIVNGISDLKVGDVQRAFWELVQNARDFSDKDCVIEICLKNDEIIFAHQGKPFDVDSLGALVMQNSSKQSDDSAMVGQYGTGFMITHIFNHIVHVSSIFEDIDEDTKEVSYYSFKDFKIDRSATTPEELCPVMQNALDLISEIPNPQNQINNKIGQTIFTYELTDEKAAQVDAIWDEIRNFIPVVMLFNKSINEISLENRIRHTKYVYKSGNEHRTQISEKTGWQKVETNIIMHSLGKEECTSIMLHSLQSDDEQDVIVIPPYPNCLSDINNVPSLFLSFPLLGTEHFGVNFIFHSNGFFPVEERNGIMLPREGSQYPEKPQTNVKILRRMFDALFAYYSNPINTATLPIDCCRVEFLNNQTSHDKELDSFYSQMHELWAKNICTWNVIDGDNNERVSIEENNVRVLESAFYDELDKDTCDHYELLMAKYASAVKLTSNEERIILPNTQLIEWSKVVNGWGKDNKEYVVTLKDVCESIKERTDDLLSFMTLINEIKQNDLLQRYALVPNREGILKTRDSLRDGSSISNDLYHLVRPIVQEKLDCLIDEEYAKLYKFVEYTWSDLQSDLSNTISSLRKQVGTSLSPTTIEESRYGEGFLNSLISYCSTFSTENSASLRWIMMPNICKIYNRDFVYQIIPNETNHVTGKAIDIYETSFNYLLDNTFLSVSKKDIEWVKANKEVLLKLIKTLLDNTKDQEHIERVKKYAIFPDRRGHLHQVETLKKAENILDDFVEEYISITGHNLYEDWIDKDFENVFEFEFVKPKEDLGIVLENQYLRPYLNKKHNNDSDYTYDEKIEKSLLTIIHHIEKGDWKDYFDFLVTNLQIISYELGTKGQKEALYTIKMNISDEKTLHDIAELSKNPDLYTILKNAQEQIEQEKEKVRQFRFTFAIGKQIEDAIRNEVSGELSVEFCEQNEQVSARDEQGGQDVIIRDAHGNDLYYIECKAKWEFHNSPAHMSTLQIKQAVKKRDRYALLCIDCTRDTGARISIDASEQEVSDSLSEILMHTKAHCDMGSFFFDSIGSLVKYEDEFDSNKVEQSIKLNSIIGCDIPKSIFNAGVPFDDFMVNLREFLQKEIEKKHQ